MSELGPSGEIYNDDRMYVLYLCKGVVTERPGGVVETKVYHDSPPSDFQWCLVTYRNTPRYLATRIDHFPTLERARAYIERTEPSVPLLSLGEKSPEVPLPYDEFVALKARNEWKDYDWRSTFSSGDRVSERTEIFTSDPR